MLDNQGKYKAAEEMHRRTLELREKVLGPKHPERLMSMNNLAVVLVSQGNYKAAEEMHQRTLELRQEVLGLEHPDTLMSMNSLAMAYRPQGKYEAAKDAPAVLSEPLEDLGLALTRRVGMTSGRSGVPQIREMLPSNVSGTEIFAMTGTLQITRQSTRKTHQ
jgi:tetratricopeptide (TPR) repeat protein